MVKASFSTTWTKSIQPRKQRKYRFNAPLHLKQKMVHVHLSPELRKKHEMRNVQIRKGDKVRVMRGKFSKKEGKVERVALKNEKVYITGMEAIKREGAKVPVAFTPSNLMIIELDLSDKKRKAKLSTNKGAKKSEDKKTEKKAEVKTEEKK